MAEAVTADSEVYRKFVELPENIRKDLKSWFSASKNVKIFVTGRTGVGKSSLVNALVGDNVAEEGDELDPQTCKVTKYEKKIRDVMVTVWDSPGLQDGTTREAEYLADMEKNCKEMDLCVYCVNTLENRFVSGCDDITAMKKLTRVFGEAMWQHAIVILTFANLLEDDAELLEAEAQQKPDIFKKKLEEWEKTLREALVQEVGIDADIAEKVKAIPAGYESEPALLDRKFWLSPLWFESLYAMKPMAQPAMMKINVHRIFRNPKEVCEEDMAKFLHEQPLIFSHRGAQIGQKYEESSVGEAVGLKMGNDASAEVQVMLTLHELASQLENFFKKFSIIIVLDDKRNDSVEDSQTEK